MTDITQIIEVVGDQITITANSPTTEIIVEAEPTALLVENSITTVVAEVQTTPIETIGIQGPAGIDGINGTGDKNYVHSQSVPSTIWNVNHALLKFPSVTVVDSAGTTVIGEVQLIDINNVRLIFSASFSGKAYFN
jgi:hypothetical protein